MEDIDNFFNEIKEEFERISPSDYLTTLVRDRPYDGQSHTDTGERGKTEVKGITFRDLRDCFIRGAFHASGIDAKEYPRTIYDLDWCDIDPLAFY
jgi:hypothetical protein